MPVYTKPATIHNRVITFNEYDPEVLDKKVNDVLNTIYNRNKVVLGIQYHVAEETDSTLPRNSLLYIATIRYEV